MMNRGLIWLAGALIMTGTDFLAAQDLGSINASLFRSYHTNLYVSTNQNRGFTKPFDPLTPRKPTRLHNAARDYIVASLTRMGLATRLDPFSFYTNFGGPTYYYTGCNNIVAVLPGADPATYGTYIVTAFYDTIDAGQPLPIDILAGPAPKSPGADLNASGVAAVLCAAKVLSSRRFMGSIMFILFDASEKNFGGSYHFVSRKTTWDPLKSTKLYRGGIRFMISIDTVGYNPLTDDHNKATVWGGSPLPTTYRRRLAKYLYLYGGITLVDGGAITSSDHVPFWESGIDSCVLSESSIWRNPFIYTASDTISKSGYIDYRYAASIARGVTAFLAAQAVPAPYSSAPAAAGSAGPASPSP